MEGLQSCSYAIKLRPLIIIAPNTQTHTHSKTAFRMILKCYTVVLVGIRKMCDEQDEGSGMNWEDAEQ